MYQPNAPFRSESIATWVFTDENTGLGLHIDQEADDRLVVAGRAENLRKEIHQVLLIGRLRRGCRTACAGATAHAGGAARVGRAGGLSRGTRTGRLLRGAGATALPSAASVVVVVMVCPLSLPCCLLQDRLGVDAVGREDLLHGILNDRCEVRRCKVRGITGLRRIAGLRGIAGLLGALNGGGNGSNELVPEAAGAAGRPRAGRCRGSRRLRCIVAGGQGRSRLAALLSSQQQPLVWIGRASCDACDPGHDFDVPYNC